MMTTQTAVSFRVFGVVVLSSLSLTCGGDAKTTAFMTAVKNGDANAVRLSLADGIDVNVKDSSGNAAIHLAVIHDKPEILKVLLDRRADINIRDQSDRTPLILAAEHNRPAIADKLLAQKADVNAQDANGDTATAIATRKNHYGVVLILKLAGGKE